MIKLIITKLINRLSKSNNGFFKNYLYVLSKDRLKQIYPKLSIHQVVITQDNYKKVTEVTKLKSYEKIFQKMLWQNQIGFFAIYNNHAVGYSWAEIKRNKNKKNTIVKLKKDEAFIHFCRTSKKFRGKSIYPFLLYKLSNFLFSEYSIKKIYIDTDINNIPSQRGIEKVGFKKIFLIRKIKILGFCVFINFKNIS